MSALKVKILSTDGRVGYTSLKRAKCYVRRHRARWIGAQAIQFEPEYARDQAGMPAGSVSFDLNTCYDHNVCTDGCTRRELRGLPMVGDIDRLMVRGKQRRSGAKQAA